MLDTEAGEEGRDREKFWSVGSLRKGFEENFSVVLWGGGPPYLTHE